MSLVQQLAPLNLIEEEEKFFKKKCNYNPQFKYQQLITLRKRERYGLPKKEYIKLAKKILDKAFANKTEEDLRVGEGERINKKTGEKMLRGFLKENNLTDKIELKWIENHISKASYYKGTLKLRSNFDFRYKKFLAALYHEIGTHALRRINYQTQPFFKKKNKFGFREYLFTEEGLASLHSLLATNNKLDYYHALIYVATEQALKGSFIDTFKFINQYLQDEHRSWRLTVKLKRGMYDTSKPGGFTKSIVYLEGIVKVSQYLQKTNFDLAGLYYGKIDTLDVEKAKELNPGFKPQLPSFYAKNREDYIKQIKEIQKINYFDLIS